MNVLSLFDGMSCGRIALDRAGIKVDNYFAAEIDKHAVKVALHNYPDTIQLGDVTQVKAADLPHIDLLIGGSPCQGFSFAGKQLNFEDPRSKLFFEYARILGEIRIKNPGVKFLLENVKMKKESRDVITEFLGVEPIEINSALVSAQNRKRLYWTNIEGVSVPKDKGTLLKDIIETSGLNVYVAGQGKEIARKNTEKALCILARDHKGFGNQTMSGVLDGTVLRRLTPLEYERLQTVPDNYTAVVSNTQRYKMLGNGWTVDVIAHIFNYLNEDLSL